MRTVSWSPACPRFLLVLSLIKQNREGFEGGLRHKGARCGDRVRGHLLARAIYEEEMSRRSEII